MLGHCYRLNAPSCIAEAVEDDLIVIHLATGRYYNMRGQSVMVWNALVGGVEPQALLAANAWQAPQNQRFEEHVGFLVQEGLLVPSSSESEAANAPIIDLDGSEDPFQVDVFTDMEEMLRLDPIHDANADVGWPQRA